MDLAALALCWRAVQFYFLSNLRKKINIVINKHNILIDCLHKLAFALSKGGIDWLGEERARLPHSSRHCSITAMHYHFSEVRHSSKTESVSQWTTRQELRAEGGSQWKSELSSSRTFHPSLWHRLGACRRCPWGTRRSWRCRGGTGWWGRWGDSSCASAILQQDQCEETVKSGSCCNC